MRGRWAAAAATASGDGAPMDTEVAHAGAPPRAAIAAAAATATLLGVLVTCSFAGVPWLQATVGVKVAAVEAFLLIFVSELGDKTFFIAALLAMRRGQRAVFVGAVLALAAMTLVSVGIGAAFNAVPQTVARSDEVTRYVASALLLWFGVRTLQDADALASVSRWFKRVGEDKTDVGAVGESDTSELEEAEEVVSQRAGRVGARANPLSVVGEAFSLTFLAEWGDRSMLATIALGAAQPPLGVAAGAIAGHAAATAIAVCGGALLSRYISEKVVGVIGGGLFVAFAVMTALGVF